MITRKDIYILAPFLLFFALFTFFVSGNSFFWDTIQLGSKQAHWFYLNNFSSLLLPDDIDSGHPPVFPAYLAVAWKIFGKSLPVSHWAMYPFLAGIVIQAYRLLLNFIDRKYIIPALLVFLADPTLLAQSSLVSPDVVLVFFFLLGINSILKENTFLIFLSILGLSLVSMRGMMAAVAVFLFHFYLFSRSDEIKPVLKRLIKIIPLYLAGSAFAVAFLIYHFMHKKWIGYHPGSSWAGSFEPALFSDFMKNIFILGWRLADFGRIFIWVILVIVLIRFRKKIRSDEKSVRLFIFCFISFLVFTPTVLLYKSLSMHRYLLPVIIMISLFTIYLVFEVIPGIKWKYAIASFLLAGLISGNFWIYGEGIAEGWDATLAHLPYYRLRKEMNSYIEYKKIPVDKTGSAFPNISRFKFTDLTGDERSYREKNLSDDRFIIQSNIFNDFTNEELKELKSNWLMKKEFRKCGIYMRLYERKE